MFFLIGNHLVVIYTKTVVILLLCALFSGCSQKYNDVNATLHEAIFGVEGIAITKEAIQKIPYASMKVSINDAPSIVMVLAFADRHPDTKSLRLKWVSSDGAMLVMEQGRIIKTLNLYGDNLVNISFQPNLTASATTNFTAIYDWQPNYSFNQIVNISSSIEQPSVVTSLIWEKDVIKKCELLTFLNANINTANYYWIDSNNQVLKSSQWLIPNKLHIEYEILKPYHE